MPQKEDWVLFCDLYCLEKNRVQKEPETRVFLISGQLLDFEILPKDAIPQK